MQDDYKKGYAHGCKAALAVYEAMLDDLKRQVATKVAQYLGGAEQRIAEAERAVVELRASMDTYSVDCERRIAEAAERYGVTFERLSETRKH